MAATLNATARTGSGKGGARKLRATGKVPAVVYGHGDKNVPLALDRHELELLLHAISVENTVISLVTDGGTGKDVLIRDGLHVLGQAPVGLPRVDLVLGVLRAQQSWGGEAGYSPWSAR